LARLVKAAKSLGIGAEGPQLLAGSSHQGLEFVSLHGVYINAGGILMQGIEVISTVPYQVCVRLKSGVLAPYVYEMKGPLLTL
jgi:hypothetical protein